MTSTPTAARSTTSGCGTPKSSSRPSRTSRRSPSTTRSATWTWTGIRWTGSSARQGQPDFIVSNFDQSKAKISVTQPRVYFGEPPQAGPDYVVVDTKQPEVDRPTPTGDTQTSSYDADGGVQLSSTARRLAFALRFRDINLLISGNITSQSRLMFNRDVRDRVEKVAPFLQWDGDPYAVVVDGRIMFVRDGYTTSNDYPYVQRINFGDAARHDESSAGGVSGSGNYIRNSVKAVVDAYTGKVTLYHLSTADELYSRKDLWSLPEDRSGEIQQQQQQPQPQSPVAALAPPTNAGKMRPYYLLTRLPGQTQPKFSLVMPFTPNNQQNMVAYLTVGSDPDDYGQMTLFSLDPARTIDGPTQVNSRILANPTVASQLSLLNQQGSKVILGNLLIVPVKDSLLYVQPIFVQSAGASQSAAINTIPLLEKVAVVLNTDVGYADTLSEAISQVVTGQPVSPTPEPPSSTTPPAQQPGASATVQQLLQRASQEYDAAQAALQKGDLAGYQQHVKAMARLLDQALGSSQGKTPSSTTPGS